MEVSCRLIEKAILYYSAKDAEADSQKIHSKDGFVYISGLGQLGKTKPLFLHNVCGIVQTAVGSQFMMHKHVSIYLIRIGHL